jgi:hypothetical protein
MEQSKSLSHLPGERFELALDSQRGMLTNPSSDGSVVTVTNQRAIHQSAKSGKRITGVLSLGRLSGMEVIDVGRPSQRLGQGLLAIGAGVVLGVLAWALFSETLFVLILGGLPALMGVYLLSGYIFPDEAGELTLYAGSYTMRLPLLTENARRDAYLVANRITELSARTLSAASGTAPEYAGESYDSDFAPEVNEIPSSNISTVSGEDEAAVTGSDGVTIEPVPVRESPMFTVPASGGGPQPPEDQPAVIDGDSIASAPVRESTMFSVPASSGDAQPSEDGPTGGGSTEDEQGDRPRDAPHS